MSRSNHKFGGKFGADPAGDPFAGQDPFASVPNVDERLADWVDGTMSSRDRERFEAEMRVSPHLREQVADYEATVASIREALNDETHETNLADRVMASLAQEASKPVPRRRSGWPFVWAVMSAAALLGIAILIDSWGGAMLVPKTETGTATHLIDPAIGGLEKGGQFIDERVLGGRENQSTENDSLASESHDRNLDAGAPTSTNGESIFELVENELRGITPVDSAKKQFAAKQFAAKQGGDLQVQKEGVGVGSLDPSASPEAQLPTGLNVTGGVETRREAKEMAVAGNGAVPPPGAPVAGKPGARAVAPPSELTAARPTSPGLDGGGSTAGRSSGPATGGPATGGPAGPNTPAPTGPAGPGSPGPDRSGPDRGGLDHGGLDRGGLDRGGLGRGGAAGVPRPGGGRSPSTKSRGGVPSGGSVAPASPPATIEEMFEKSGKPKDAEAPGSEQPRLFGSPDSRSSDAKRRKGSVTDDDTRGRPLAEQRSREFLMRLSAEKSVGELLPLVTLEGLAIAFELPEQDKQQPVAGEQGGVRPRAQTGSDDFYMGATRMGQRQMLRGFFDRQMQPAPEWREALRQADKKGAASRKQLEPEVVSIGGLQLFAVGPVDSAEEAAEVSSAEANRAGAGKQDPNVVHETKPKSLQDIAKTETPGEWDANGGAVVQRDWLVVGPKSEVAKLLVALRRYSDDANSRKFLTAEVRLVKPDLQREGRAKALRTSDGSDPAKNGPATKPKPADTASPLPAARVEPTQRVVIRFRVRR